MIRSVDIKDPSNTPLKWLPKVPVLAKPRKFEFTPGLNILWGKNGSGKSTVISLMASLFHCAQGGVPRTTASSVGDLFGFNSDKDAERLAAVQADHDGQGVCLFDPGLAVGLIGGGFDYDFMTEGVMNATMRGSAGETTLSRSMKVLKVIETNKAPEVVFGMDADAVNSLWAPRVKAVEKFLKGSGEKGPLTILMDEPERSLDIIHQAGMWRMLRDYSAKIQFIVASHSLYALNLPKANYIELTPGYLEASKRCLVDLPKFASETREV